MLCSPSTARLRRPFFLAALLLLAAAVALPACDSNERDFDENGVFPDSFRRLWISGNEENDYYAFSADEITVREIRVQEDDTCKRVTRTELLGRDGALFRLRNPNGATTITRITEGTNDQGDDVLILQVDGANGVLLLPPAAPPPDFDALPNCNSGDSD